MRQVAEIGRRDSAQMVCSSCPVDVVPKSLKKAHVRTCSASDLALVVLANVEFVEKSWNVHCLNRPEWEAAVSEPIRRQDSVVRSDFLIGFVDRRMMAKMMVAATSCRRCRHPDLVEIAQVPVQDPVFGVCAPHHVSGS